MKIQNQKQKIQNKMKLKYMNYNYLIHNKLHHNMKNYNNEIIKFFNMTK